MTPWRMQQPCLALHHLRHTAGTRPHPHRLPYRHDARSFTKGRNLRGSNAPKNSNGLMHLQPRGEAHEESCRISRFVIDTHNPARVVALHGASLQRPSGNHLANGLAPPGHRVLVHAPSGFWKLAFPLFPQETQNTPHLPTSPPSAGHRRRQTSRNGAGTRVITSIQQASINTSSTGPVRLETTCGQGPAVARHGPWR